MTKYFYRLDPGCEGELGDQTDVDFTKPFLHQTKFLHLHITGMLAADLSFIGDCWIVTESFRTLAIEKKTSGCSFVDMVTTFDDELKKLYPELFPVKLWRMLIIGAAFVDDIGLKDYNIIASQSLIEILNLLHYNHYSTTIEIGGEAAKSLIAHRRKSYW